MATVRMKIKWATEKRNGGAWADNGRTVVLARNVDWAENPKTDLLVLPRGVKRKGTAAGKPAEWSSKYASIVGVAYDNSVNTGMNEKGLAAKCMWLATRDAGTRDEGVLGLSEAERPMFYLDQFAAVVEAVSRRMA